MIKSLTSLRFVFALMVLLSHCIRIDPFFDKHIFQEGFVGVSFFFVLSGFIISYSNKKGIEEKSVSRRRFWIARVARIYPLHVFTLLLAVLLHFQEITQSLSLWLLHFIPNLLLCQAFIPEKSFYYSFNSPSWSLCCEMLFYAVFPFFVKWFYSLRRLVCILFPMAILILISMYVCMYVCMYVAQEDQVLVNTVWYVNPIVRLCDFLIGMFLYELFERFNSVDLSYKKASFLELTTIVIFLLFYISASSFSIVYRASAYYWIPISLVVFVFAIQRGCISKFLSNKYLFYLGEISFGIYLFHFLIIDVFIRLKHRLGLELHASASLAILLFVTLLVSSLSFRYFEKPANRWVKNYFKRKSDEVYEAKE